jgi:hypothetical protein
MEQSDAVNRQLAAAIAPNNIKKHTNRAAATRLPNRRDIGRAEPRSECASCAGFGAR